MPDLRIQITDFLKAHGPARPREILDKVGGKQGALNRVLAQMLEAKELAAAGATKGRTYALPGQKLDAGAAPARRKAKKSPRRAPAKKKRTAHRRARRTHRAPKAAPAPFLASITADHRLVINHGADGPQVFSPEHTREIADIAFANFEQ